MITHELLTAYGFVRTYPDAPLTLLYHRPVYEEVDERHMGRLKYVLCCTVAKKRDGSFWPAADLFSEVIEPTSGDRVHLYLTCDEGTMDRVLFFQETVEAAWKVGRAYSQSPMDSVRSACEASKRT